MKYCHNCKTPWEGITQPGVRDTCEHCSADLHVCLNCRFYDEHKPNACMQYNAEPVIDKERVNFCEEFQFISRKQEEETKSRATPAKAQFDKLFKKN